MKISKADYPIIANMRMSGCTWKAIAMTFGMTDRGLLKHKVHIDKLITEGEVIDDRTFAKANYIKLAIKAEKDSDKITATDRLVNLGNVSSTTTKTKSTTTIVEEITNELSSN